MIEDFPSLSGKDAPSKGFEFVLTMRESLGATPAEDDFVVGNAVLVGDLLAITATHCLLSGKDYLWVRSARYPQACARVVGILWPDEERVVDVGISRYPVPDARPEDIVGLVLDRALTVNRSTIKPVVIAEPIEDEKWKDLLLALAAPSPPHFLDVIKRNPSISMENLAETAKLEQQSIAASGVKYFTFVGEASGNGAVVARGIPDSLGYPLESGAAILSAESIVYGKVVPKPELRGLQISAPGLMPPPTYASSSDRYIGILPLDKRRKEIIDFWKSGNQRKVTPVPVVGPRRFVIRHYRDRHVMTGRDLLVEIKDIQDFHNKRWRLYAVRAGLGMLRTGLKLYTNVEDGRVILSFLKNEGEEIERRVELFPAGISTIKGYFWMYGRSEFRGKVVHYYLFFLQDFGEGSGPPDGKKRIRLAVFDADGPHVGDRPEYHLIHIVDERFIGYSFAKSRGRADIVSDDDRVQDDVGNGHEGYQPPTN